MIRLLKVGVLLGAVALLGACEAPGEKSAQEALAQVRLLKAAGNKEATLAAARKVSTGYPETKAAAEAKKISTEVEAEITAELEKEAAKAKKELEEMTAKAQRISDKIRASKDLLAGLKSKSDDMKSVAWFRAKNDGLLLGSWLKVYFGIFEKDGQSRLGPLRMVVQLEDSDWVFARKAIFKVDGKVFEVEPPDWQHENSSGSVWETADFALSDSHAELRAALAQAREVKIRFDGRHRVRDINIPPYQLQMVKQVETVWQEINSAGIAK